MTVHYFAKKLAKSQIEALADCDYDGLLDIYPDRVERSAGPHDDDVVDADAHGTLCHIIGTRIDLATDMLDEEPAARNHLRQLERLLEAVGLAYHEVLC